MQVGSPHFATRMNQAIEKSILDKMGNNAFVRRMNGEVTAVDTATMTASVKILSNATTSTGFKIRSATVPVVGDKVSVCIDGQERWVESILAGAAQKKLVVGSDGLLQWGAGGAAFDTTLYRSAADILKTDDTFEANRLRLNATDDIVTLATTTQAFQIGATAGENLAVDANEIQARNNGAAAPLLLNQLGGHGYIGGSTSVIRTGGSGFPASPAANDLWYHTGQLEWYRFDGTRWRCTINHALPLPSVRALQPASATTSAQHIATVPPSTGSNDIWLYDLAVTYQVASGGTALGASHLWEITVRKTVNNSATETILATVTINSGSSGVWRESVIGIDALQDNGTAHVGMIASITKTGTPGNLYSAITMTYNHVTN